MAQKIIRIYDAATEGANVAKRLREAGFEHVFHITGTTGKNTATVDRSALVASLMNAQIWKGHAEAYADRLSKGGALVAVHAPFGAALSASKILDSYGPSETGIAETSYQDYVWDEAAPLSSVLRMPVLTKMKLPAETLTGISSLSKGDGFLSTLLAMPLLKRGLQHATSSFGLPLLSRSATPLSSATGMPTLSRNATPLSSLFGLPVLRRNRR